MSTRIRYINGPNIGELTSLRIFSNDKGREFKARIFHGGKSGAVLDAVDDSIVDTVTGTSSHQTKIALKEALSRLGVNFGAESRVRSSKDASSSSSES